MMILFTLLICFVLQRYFQLSNAKLSPLFRMYLSNSQGFFKKFETKQPLIFVILLILPITLLVGLLNIVLEDVWFNSLDFLFQLFILFYCIQFDDPKVSLAYYFDAENRQDEQGAFRYGAEYLGEEAPNDMVDLARNITKKIFSDADRYVFSVLFWYILVGPAGAVTYAISRSLASRKTDQETFLNAAKYLHALLDWVPTRIVGLTYALTGHFVYGFAYWRKHVLDGVMASRDFASNVGLCALEREVDSVVAADTEENEQALIMVNRSLILVVVLVAVFTLVSWIA